MNVESSSDPDVAEEVEQRDDLNALAVGLNALADPVAAVCAGAVFIWSLILFFRKTVFLLFERYTNDLLH